MYSVMLVEDEKPARELLKMQMHWHYSEFYICHEAFNGHEALEFYKNKMQPDIIITDIQMPGMDGLALIEEIRKLKELQSFIILSCHESFQYAKQAIRLGVKDYLIKDSITPEDLYGALRHAVNATAQPRARDIASSSHPEVKAAPEMLCTVLNNDSSPSLLKHYFDFYHFNESRDWYFIVTISIEDNLVFSCIMSLLNEMNAAVRSYDGIACHMGEQDFACLSFLAAGHSELNMANQKYSITNEIRNAIQDIVLNATVTMGVSTHSHRLEDMYEKYQEAKRATDYCVFMGKGKTLYYKNDSLRSVPFDILNLRIIEVKTALQNMNITDIDKKISSFFKVSYQGFAQYNYLKYVSTVLINLLMESCIIQRVSYKQVFGDLPPVDTINQLESAEMMSDWFCSRFQTLFDMIGSSPKYTKQVQSIVNYINDNYTKNIGLRSIAEHFNYTKVYVAHLFKDATGRSVNSYITRIRIEKAKVLLETTQYHINEIMYSVGFNTPQDFYMKFKKIVGMSPTRYRANLRH